MIFVRALALIVIGAVCSVRCGAVYSATNSSRALTTVALSSQFAADPSEFGRFSLPAINDHGQTSFLVDVANGEVGIRSIWTDRNGGLERVAETGAPAPGTSSAFYWFQDPLIDNSGRIVFSGSYFDDDPFGLLGTGLWQSRDATVEPIVVKGTFTESADSDQFLGVSEVRLHREGQLAFTAALGRGSPRAGSIWLQNDEGRRMISRSDQQPADLLDERMPSIVRLRVIQNSPLIGTAR